MSHPLTDSISKASHEALLEQLAAQSPFSKLPEEELKIWLSSAKRVHFAIGQRILRPDELNPYIYLVLQGNIRLIAIGSESEGQISLGLRGPGQLLGWISLLRGTPTEFVRASTDVVALKLSATDFISIVRKHPPFASCFNCLTNPHETYLVAQASAELQPIQKPEWQNDLRKCVGQSIASSIYPGEPLNSLPEIPSDWSWFLSTPSVPGYAVGTTITNTLASLPERPGFLLPYRLVALPRLVPLHIPEIDSRLATSSSSVNETSPVDMHKLGILEDDLLIDEERYPLVRGRGPLNEVLAVCEMVALQYEVPFRRDAVQKVLEVQLQRDNVISLELLSGLCELLGMTTQLAETASIHIGSVESPAVLILDGIPIIFQGLKKGKAIILHPHLGVKKIPQSEFISSLGEKFRFSLPRRSPTTPTSRFGWHWFTPLLKKYSVPLALVFISSFLAQLFGLAIPLLLQQIIDKVLTQGNLSSLNILGAAMIIMALFQGFLQALRTFIFVDTTDRMDLTLGSAVIDRLLSLPLGFFERRPVGELSQRIGELNTVRSFLTGTALLSVINIIFALLYIVVMLVYSPLLSCVALSTLPIYLVLVFVVSPIYKSFIRKRAEASAKTQSHLIEIISGIQTVKAQHFELTARWKWQDRYRKFVSEGFKSAALGATASEIGNFLNQISGLLVLWVGMWMVLNGDFTLGQLIAFRIISGNVTSPLLQLAGLYQGFQSVQLSMERLSDIVDQNPESQNSEEVAQISLPPINGNVRFENVTFRFAAEGPYQLEDVTVDIVSGSFVGIVGQSGSGKSTLMKLLPRLYEQSRGRIFIDDYDVRKVNLLSLRQQIGIVPQDSLLFEGSIAENIALNDPLASTESIINAANLAEAHDFIMSLPNGYATNVAERGSNLSGGQRQRIAIARTVLSSPRLLVMDEATSALDYDTERKLCLNIQRWSAGRTVFFITHRLSTVKSADLILVMHKGRLVEKGTHSELMQLNLRYASLLRQQDSLS